MIKKSEIKIFIPFSVYTKYRKPTVLWHFLVYDTQIQRLVKQRLWDLQSTRFKNPAAYLKIIRIQGRGIRKSKI